MSRRGLSLAEQETIFLWDNEQDTARVYTHDQRLIHKLKALSEQYPGQFVLVRRGPSRAVTYQVPKKCIGIRPPYSDERKQRQKQAARENGLPFLTGRREKEE